MSSTCRQRTTPKHTQSPHTPNELIKNTFPNAKITYESGMSNFFGGTLLRRAQPMTSGMASATIGVLFKKALANMTGIMRRTRAKKTLRARPNARLNAPSSAFFCFFLGGGGNDF